MALDAFALVLCLFAAGKLAARLGLFPSTAAEVLNLFVLYVCLPAAVLRHAPALRLEPALLGLVAVPWAMLLAGAGLAHLAARALRLGRSERAVLLLCVPLGNTSFLGYPMTEALLGREALPYAVAYDQLGSFVALSTWGLWVLARYGGGEPPTGRVLLGRLLRFPPFPALLLALTVMPESPPALVAGLLDRLSGALLPVVAFALGLQLRLRLPRAARAPLAAGLALKLAVLPGLALALVRILGLAPLPGAAAVLESAMPPMSTAAALASSHRLAPELAAALAGFGVLAALVTLPLWAVLLT
ncbi:MAG TPA: AEC family transporter [Thermoanaerobaculia bacterium]|nr:AEC family transporter [Thermoanaerobaculia bacterium]